MARHVPQRMRILSSDSITGAILLLVALAVLAIVAASEAAVASASRLRVKGLATRGVARAQALQPYLDERASTLGSLAVGRNLAVVLTTALAIFLIMRERGHSWMLFAGIAGATLAAVALLDTLPRLVVANDPERWALRLVPVVRMFRVVFEPLARAIDRSLAAVVRTNGEGRGDDATAELLRRADIDTDGEPIEEEERQMIRGIIEMEETTAREIMVPRIDIASLDVGETIDDALKIIVERGFSRIPVYDETIDNIVGVIYAKDLLRCLAENRRPALNEIARPPYFIPESKRVDELLGELRQSKVHMAIIVDEYGGTAGLVTIEDLLEEIVGEIQDEYDREEARIERVNESEAILDARVSIDALRELFDFDVRGEEQDYDTIGGFVYHHLGKVPVAGDEVQVDGLTLRVLSVIGRRIKKVRARRSSHEESVVSAQ